MLHSKNILLFSFTLLLCSCGWLLRPHFSPLNSPNLDAWPNTQFSQTKVNINEFSEGGIPKDGIPPIDHPKYIAQEKAIWLGPLEPVIVMKIGMTVRAYPLQIMLYHEIVNDTIDGLPVTITFCPLCNTALAFERRLGNRLLDFGTTGLLRKSDLVMYDRQTESWWQQFTGEAVVGELTGQTLIQLDTEIVSFAKFQKNFPDGKVLSRDTGFNKPYGKNYIMGYDTIDSSPYYYTDQSDTRLKPMQRVLGVSVKGKNWIYPLSILEEKPIINDVINTVPVVVFYQQGMRVIAGSRNVKNARLTGAATVYERYLEQRILSFIQLDDQVFDEQTQSSWNYFGLAISGPLKGKQLKSISQGVHFSFAWLAFRPDSEIYGQDKKGE
jgi:hypothetical protein